MTPFLKVISHWEDKGFIDTDTGMPVNTLLHATKPAQKSLRALTLSEGTENRQVVSDEGRTN